MRTTGRLDYILESLEQAATLEGLQRAGESLRDQWKIEHVAYLWVGSSGHSYGCSTYSQAWQDLYFARNYQRIDPVVQGCFQRFHPVDWKELDWSSKAARAFQAEAMAHGVGNQGFTTPLRGPNGQFAMFSANHTCDDPSWARFIGSHRRDLVLVAHYLNEKALELEPDRFPEHVQALSPREVDAMTLLAFGYNRAQVAEQLSISEHTLRAYIESARFKLGALNTTHAVARALSRGLIVV